MNRPPGLGPRTAEKEPGYELPSFLLCRTSAALSLPHLSLPSGNGRTVALGLHQEERVHPSDWRPAMSEGMNVQLIPLDAIRVGDRKRVYREDQIVELAESISQLDLLNPISVVPSSDGEGYILVAGLHRLEACRSLGWDTIPASVLALDDLDRELAEIDENLHRSELSILETGEHLARRDEILRAKGERKPGHRPKKGDTVSPLQSTADLAADAGIGERSAQRYMRIARELPSEVRDLLRPTAFAEQTGTLENLAKVKKGEDRLELARLLANGEVESFYDAERELKRRHFACKSCGEILDRFDYIFTIPIHCDQCGDHFAMATDEYLEVCGKCGWKAHPDAKPPDPTTAATSPAPSPTPSPIGVTAQPRIGPFYKKDDYRRPDGTSKIEADDFLRALGADDSPTVPEGKARVDLLVENARRVVAISAPGLAGVTDEQLRAEVRDIVGRLRDWLAAVEAEAEWLSGEEVRQ
jgi:predicted  nucleic acid-binding Zn-ribbon protein